MKFIALILIISFASCRQHAGIVIEKEYSSFLKGSPVQEEENKIRAEIRFWSSRLMRDTGNFVDMLEIAKCRLSLFKLKGNVIDLYKGDSLLKASSWKLRNTNAGILYSLSQAAIS